MTLRYDHFIDPHHMYPVVGYPMTMKNVIDEMDEGKITFGEAVILSMFAGALQAGHMIFAAQHSYMAAMRFQRTMLLAWNPLTYATLGVVAGTYALTKPGANVSMGPYGSVRVMPRLGIF